ncbi:MAG: hypothetical protein KDA53_05850 [Hyphomonas sp.]|nr:hypothetical protein [Hyphomonas sp.]
MFLRRVTAHVKTQNWFAVVLDFVIVVLGILIAFQITNWNDGRKAKAQLAEAETAIKSDLFLNYVWAKERLSLRTCRVEQLGQLSARLLEPGETWTGLPNGRDELGEARAIAQVLRSPNRPWGGRIWQAELARGTFIDMNSRQREDLDFVFKQAGDVETHQTRITDLQSRLKVLSNSMELSRSDRLRYYDMVSEIDENSFWMELKASQLCSVIETLGLSYDEAELAILKPRVAEILDLELRRTQYGACVEPVTITLFESPGSEAAAGPSSCTISGFN